VAVLNRRDGQGHVEHDEGGEPDVRRKEPRFTHPWQETTSMI
jgi:hypothetical protein